MVKKILLWAAAVIAAVVVLGFMLNSLFTNLTEALTGGAGAFWEPKLLLDGKTYLYGVIALVLVALLYFLFHNNAGKRASAIMRGKAKGIEGALENSRFMNDKERDYNFKPYKFTKLNEEKKDGIPVRAFYSAKKKELDINLASPMHGLIIGATGSGKTTTFIHTLQNAKRRESFSRCIPER